MKKEKIEIRGEHLALSTIGHLVSPATYIQFQHFIQVKAQELEITFCAKACNFIASQEQVGGDYQVTGTMYLPKHYFLLDMGSLEANNISELVVNTTQPIPNNRDKQQQGKSPNRKYNNDYRKNDGNRSDRQDRERKSSRDRQQDK